MNTEKTGNAVLYFLSYAKRPLGPYHLSKLLYFIDSRFYMFYDRTITELDYARLPNGPAPDNYDSKFALLMEQGYIDAQIPAGKEYPEYFNLAEPDLTVFDLDEIEILKGVTETYTNKSFKELFDITHEEKPYCLSKYKMGEIFDFKDLRDTKEEFLSAIEESLSNKNIIRFDSTEELLQSLGL